MADAPNAQLVYRRFRAPSGHGEAFHDPPFRSIADSWNANRQKFDRSGRLIGGDSLESFRQRASLEALQLAIDYSSRYLPIANLAADESLHAHTSESGSLLMAGHQPELFHPGVWYKNFGLSRAAQQVGAPSVNLIVDNDVCTFPSIKIAKGSFDQPESGVLAIDQQAKESVWECRPVISESLFESFPDRLRSESLPLSNTIIAESLWRHVPSSKLQALNLGGRLAAMRHAWEHQYGLTHWEVPLSKIVETDSFSQFAKFILRRAGEFREIHNSALREYRSLHRLRGATHPVPDLSDQAELMEVPFWGWQEKAGQRRKLYVELEDDRIRLTDQNGFELSIDADCDSNLIVAAKTKGYVIRPRALMTTLYSRLVLSSLFLHGIGGAKYDQITDLLIDRFFGIEAPDFFVLTATMYAAWPYPPIDDGETSRIRQQIRDLEYHPENHIQAASASSSTLQLIQDKDSLIENQPLAGSKLSWHRSVESLNHALQAQLVGRKQELLASLANATRELSHKQILRSREFSFVMFDESLASQLDQMAQHELS